MVEVRGIRFVQRLFYDEDLWGPSTKDSWPNINGGRGLLLKIILQTHGGSAWGIRRFGGSSSAMGRYTFDAGAFCNYRLFDI